MKMTLPKEWYEEKLPAEDGLEIGAGCPAVPCSLPKYFHEAEIVRGTIR